MLVYVRAEGLCQGLGFRVYVGFCVLLCLQASGTRGGLSVQGLALQYFARLLHKCVVTRFFSVQHEPQHHHP